jgi:hypothetical protein
MVLDATGVVDLGTSAPTPSTISESIAWGHAASQAEGSVSNYTPTVPVSL